MSIFVMAKVWQYDLPHPEQAVLLSMADHANDDGERIFPSMERIAWKTGYSKRQVQRVVQSLKESGVLVVVAPARWNRPTEYRIDFDKATPKPPYPGDETRGDKMSRGDTQVTQRGDTQMAQRDDAQVSPEPSSTTNTTIPSRYDKQGDLPLAGSSDDSEPVTVGEKKDRQGEKRRSAPKTRPAKKEEESPAAKHTHGSFYSALKSVTDLDDSIRMNRGRLNRAAKELRESGNYAPADVLEHFGPGGWWWTKDFRGVREHKKPTPEWVLKHIGEAKDASIPRADAVSIGGGAWSIPG